MTTVLQRRISNINYELPRIKNSSSPFLCRRDADFGLTGLGLRSIQRPRPAMTGHLPTTAGTIDRKEVPPAIKVMKSSWLSPEASIPVPRTSVPRRRHRGIDINPG
ncbi:uncharacterized protein VDAG_08596 [Verticillium dahliae VdLs.17]|uniref:Uncharacterized protein n=1 Tax=Verticillium dahliae (strain VdLs.17 / ATCC MYA-4575 / FGSC 10137) TaxID=498257 RepID=G2XEL1_VERDV|nr:uncharacterized protein VDAG_08596 [Verticillium dahliae VdLs.17]EGY18262.1 hypothetical protein VDAG_08596 [Verticillium dahliae VdLs.17]